MAPHIADEEAPLFSAAGIAQTVKNALVPALSTTTLSPPSKPVVDSPGCLSADHPNRAWIMGREAFEKVMPHHQGIKELWETKWQFPCTKSLYPFHDGLYADFLPIFTHLINNSINSGTSPEYTNAFLPVADALVAHADKLLSKPLLPPGRKKEASEIYLRACAVYRIARFPYITSRGPRGVNDKTKWEAWTAQKSAYLKAARLWASPVREVMVPHVRRKENEGAEIPVYVRCPVPGPDGGRCWPTVILLTGLDGYRPDNTVRCDEFLRRGWASVVLEIPGTADCPSDPADPEAPERLWDSLFEWMERDGRFDMGRLMMWGLSSGGYYAVRIAHTHRERLIGSVAQGAGVHHFFDRDWIERADGHEYPFQLSPAFAMKHGYGEDVEGYKSGVQEKFSLLKNGILEKESCRLLLVNGVLDGLMPIEDSIMLMEHGSPKEARFFAGALHMGYPAANSAVYPWMESVMKSK